MNYIRPCSLRKMLLLGFMLVFLSISAIAAGKPATFVNTCKCTNCTGHDRWKEKIDVETPPEYPAVERPSDIAAWEGPGIKIAKTGKNEHRLAAEQKWYQVTGKVVLVRAEGDGDLHIELMDASSTDSNTARAIDVEVPSNTEVRSTNPWCSIRKIVFSWSTQTFPFTTTDKLLTLKEHPVITVVGESFYDTDHAPKGNKTNSRPAQKNVSVWEIHPVMTLTVVSH